MAKMQFPLKIFMLHFKSAFSKKSAKQKNKIVNVKLKLCASKNTKPNALSLATNLGSMLPQNEIYFVTLF